MEMGQQWVNLYNKSDDESSNSSSVSAFVDLQFWPTATWNWGRSSRLSLLDTVFVNSFLPVVITTKMLHFHEIFGTVGIGFDPLHFITQEVLLLTTLEESVWAKDGIHPDKEACRKLNHWKPKDGLAIFCGKPSHIRTSFIVTRIILRSCMCYCINRSLGWLNPCLSWLKTHAQWFDLYVGRLKPHFGWLYSKLPRISQYGNPTIIRV